MSPRYFHNIKSKLFFGNLFHGFWGYLEVLADERTGWGLLGVRLGLELYEVNVFMATNEVLKLPTCSFDIVVYGNIKGHFIKTLNCLNLLKCIMILPCEIDYFVESTLVDLHFSYFHCCGIQYCGPPSLNSFLYSIKK